MKIFKMIGNCLFIVIVVLLFLIIVFSFNSREKAPLIGDYSLLTVHGTSMKPLLKKGDLIAVNRDIKENYLIGDIVSFWDYEKKVIVTHAIVDVEIVDGVNRYFTKGVNNINQDKNYITNKQIIGEYKGFRIPIIGYVSIFASTNVGYLLLMIVPLGLIFVYLFIELMKEISNKKGEI